MRERRTRFDGETRTPRVIITRAQPTSLVCLVRHTVISTYMLMYQTYVCAFFDTVISTYCSIVFDIFILLKICRLTSTKK